LRAEATAEIDTRASLSGVVDELERIATAASPPVTGSED
jgi:hypothetical protein